MWSDELDNKMRETTEASHPAYEERAWVKMEELLDQHLPQKRKRRFIPLLLLPLAIVGTGIFFAIQQRSESKITTENIKASQPITSGEDVQNRKENKAAIIAPSPGGLTQRNERIGTEEKNMEAGNTLSKPSFKTQTASLQKTVADKTIVTQQVDQPRESTNVDGNKQSFNAQQKEIAEERPVTSNNSTTAPLTPATDQPVTDKPASNDTKDGKQAQVDDPTKKSPSKTKDSRGTNFAFTFSAGPDISSVNFSEPGEWRMAYGVGVIYSLSKKISLRTGFFAGRKIYTANPDDYHSDYNPPASLQKIEANCLVYEIPLNVLYSFPKLKKHNWFVGGGLSSYLMKEETYDYVHKDPWGQVRYYTANYKNENAHFFSVANLSGGYQYHFSDRFSMMAEPYVKIPLTGVGQGKVQLNSGGIMFTAAFRPFVKKN